MQLYDTKWDGDFLLIALELCNCSVQDCVSDKKFSIDKIELLRQATTGLEFLHNNTMQPKDAIINLMHQYDRKTVLTCKGPRKEGLVHIAVGCGHIEMIKAFKGMGFPFDVRCIDAQGNGYIHYLGKWSSSNITDVTRVLVEMNVALDSLNNYDQTVAHVLPHYGVRPSAFHEWVEYLIAIKKQSLLAKPDKRNFTFLHYVMMIVDVLDRTMRLFRRCYLHVNSPDNLGRVPLHYAVYRGRSKAKFDGLIKCGADWTITDNGNRTVLHFAVWGGNVEAIEYFIKLGADVDARDNQGKTPLHYLRFAPLNHIEVTNLMLKKGADIYAVDQYGDTPAHDYEDTWKKKNRFLRDGRIS